MWKAAACWVAGISALGLLDAHLNRRHDGSTLSEVTRLIFRTDTPVGRAVFTVALFGGAACYRRHICKETAWQR